MAFWRSVGVFFLAGLIGAVGSPCAVRGDATIWFEDVRHSPALGDGEAAAVAAHVRHRLLELPAGELPLMPSAVRDDFFPRVVFVSASDGRGAARVAVGTARGVLKAADEAIAQLRATEKDLFKPRWLKLDIPATIILQDRTRLDRPLEFERSLFGIAFPRQMRVALVPEELIAGEVVNHHQELLADQLLAYLDRRRPTTDIKALAAREQNVAIFRFSTQSYFMDRDEVVPLYRGHRLVTRITRDQLKAAVKEAANYIVRGVDPYGQFNDTYQPSLDRVPDGYSIVRHLGAILALADAYEVLKDADLLAATKRAVDFADGVAITWTQEGKRVPGATDEGRVTLGANALSMAAFARLAAVTDDKKLLERARRFADAVLIAQQADGGFIQYQRFPDGLVYNLDNPYHLGQAVYSLMIMRRSAPEEALTDAAEKTARHLIYGRDKDQPIDKLLQDHWLLRGLNELARHRPSPLFLAHSARISSAMCQLQYTDPPFTDWSGGYYLPPDSMSAAVRTEGLVAAYTLLRDKGGHEYRGDVKRIIEACVRGAAFELQCQYRPENVMYFRDPQRALGAFRESLTSPDIRIDFVQHNMMALLSLWRIMEQEKVISFAVPRHDADAPRTPAGGQPPPAQR
jgi:hypothetical protein